MSTVNLRKRHKRCRRDNASYPAALPSGVATSAAQQVAHDAFLRLEINRIEINVLTDNLASNKVAIKTGAVFEGAFRNKLFHNGRSCPANSYSLIPSDLQL